MKIANIKNERRDITSGSTYIKRIVNKYYEQLSAYKFDNLDKTD